MERLIRDVSHIAQLERGGFQVEKRETDICSFLKPILESYNHLLGNRFSFQGCPEEGPIIIQADPDRLQQVMENIISNAIKHGQADTIKISINSSDGFCMIRIADNGSGILDEHKIHVFERSFKHGKTAGTGLGLYITKKTIERYEGAITLKDNYPKGTIFVIKLKNREEIGVIRSKYFP